MVRKILRGQGLNLRPSGDESHELIIPIEIVVSTIWAEKNVDEVQNKEISLYIGISCYFLRNNQFYWAPKYLRVANPKPVGTAR